MKDGSPFHAKLIVWIYICFWISPDQSAERFFKIARVEWMLHVFLRYSQFQRLLRLWASAQSRRGSPGWETVKFGVSRINGFVLLSFPAGLNFWFRGPEEAKNLSGEISSA